MGDHFVLLVDRLITASTLEAAIQSRNMSQISVADEKSSTGLTAQFNSGDCGDVSTVPKLVECRICQDEDHDCNMETPCACCGSLKYAHRKCIQRWCNEKGDTTCEICHQPFRPNYTAPPQMFHYGGIPMNFRGSWEISRQDLHNPQFIAMVATDRSFLDSDYDDFTVSSTRSALCCRAVAVIFTVLLLLKHALPIIIGETDEYALTILTLLLLKTAGVLIPVYVAVRAFGTCYRRRQRQEAADAPLGTSDDEDEERLHVIHVS
ncbi:unnamed protein product [Victoria cruziana]